MREKLKPNEANQTVIPKVAVIIVNWNGERFLDQCLAALNDQTFAPYEIIVVDNSSTDGSLEIIRRYSPVRLLAQDENLGFARGNNLAIKNVSPEVDWIALLNPDAFAAPDWLENLMLAAKNNPDVTVFGSRQLMHDSPEKLDGIGDVYHISGLVWRNGFGRPQKAEDNIAREIFSPCACAALYRKDVLMAAGGFDEDYFCYVEDVDLGFRLRLAGNRAMYVPDAVVRHIGSASSGGKQSNFSVYHGYRNVVWTFIKNMPGPMFLALLPLHLLANVMILYGFARQGQGKTILRAQWDACRSIPRMWRKRRIIQANRKTSISGIWHIMDKRIPQSMRGRWMRLLLRTKS